MRCRQRGVATTEAVVSLSVMAVLLGGMFHLYGLLGASLEAQAEARQRAWALRDAPQCARGGTSLGGGDRSGLPEEVAEKVPGGLGAIFSYGRARAESSLRAPLRPLVVGEAAGRRVRARAVVTCNEPDHGGLVDVLVGILRHVSGL